MMQTVLERTRQRPTAPATSSGIDAHHALAIVLVIKGHTPLPGPIGKLIDLFHVPLPPDLSQATLAEACSP